MTSVTRLIIGSFFLVTLSLFANEHWARIVFSGKGRFTDTPVSHSLTFFTANPLLRDDGDDLCTDCRTLESRARDTASLTSKLTAVGTLAGFKIWDLIYSGTYKNLPVNWKSVLVQTGPDRYAEIYHLQASGLLNHLSPTRIVHASAETILATGDPDGGNGGGCWEAYWWFDKSGPHQIDFSVLAPAIASRVPPRARFSTSCSEVRLEDAEIESWVQDRNANCHACGLLGKVTAHFRLHGARVDPLNITFVPATP